MKRYERLGWQSADQVGIDSALAGLQSRLATSPKSIYEIVWNKAGRVFDLTLVAIRYFALEDYSSSRTHAIELVRAADEFFFGSWRTEAYTLENGERADEACIRQQFKWMDSFEAAALWASVLGDWNFLKKVGTFPKPDSHVDSEHGKQGRDLYVALGAFLRDAPDAELENLLDRAAAGPKKLCKLVIAIIRAGLVRDPVMFQKGLVELLKYHKKNEFPKNLITKKISFEGTLFVHWAEKEKIPLEVPPEFEDHIVRLK